MLPISEYLALRERPPGKPVMYQRWRDLLFLHFSLEPEKVQCLLPEGLTVDTFPNSSGQERAWVGLVPFRMEGIRPRGLPAAPWLSAFPETNVRTYVHRDGKEPGVWFFSLDASRRIACSIARRWYRLPYLHSFMKVERSGERIRYSSRRIEKPFAELSVSVSLGDSMAVSEPGSLEFFLVERYLLYASRSGELLTGRVFHRPYALRAATLESCSQGLVQALGIECGEWEHVCFSEGVDVEVWGLEPKC